MNNNKGFIFILVILTIVFVIGLSAAFFMRSISEKRLVDREKYAMQASFLGEAGANHGLSELRERIRIDLSTKVDNIGSSSILDAYYTAGTVGNPLGFLVDYAYEGSEDQFEISESTATLTLADESALPLEYDFDGDYEVDIKISAQTDPDPSYPNTNPTNPADDVYVFYYNYEIVGMGSSTATSPNIIKNTYLMENFSVTVRLDDFAKYALFTNKHTSPPPENNPVWFSDTTNFSGPVHTNDEFSFAGNPSAYFEHAVTQSKNRARYFNDGNPVLLDEDSNASIDVPTFNASFTRGAAQVNINSAVDEKNLSRQAWGAAGGPGVDGIYLPSDGSDNLTGGIYIRGDVSSLVCAAAAAGPQYTITQGATTKTITIDYNSNTTTVVAGGFAEIPFTYQGIPNGIDDEGILIYGRDNINNVSGTVQSATVMTLAAGEDLVISGNLSYQDTSGDPIASDATNMLGIVSCKGDVRISTTAPDNIQIVGIVVAPLGVFTVDDYDTGSPRGTATLLGGMITNYYGAFGTSQGGNPVSGYGRDFVYDGRVLTGQIPPFFPQMNNFVSIEEGLSTRPLWSNIARSDSES